MCKMKTVGPSNDLTFYIIYFNTNSGWPWLVLSVGVAVTVSMCSKKSDSVVEDRWKEGETEDRKNI